MASYWDPSKWEIHRLYSKNRRLRKYLPPTSILSEASLKQYLDEYRTVYIKGSTQHTGAGIIQATKTGRGYRFVKVQGEPVSVKSISELYEKVKDGRPSRSIIVQKAIDMASIQGRPFSIRLMLMRNGNRKWEYAGMIAKVAGEGSVVTNVRRGGGYATTVEDALARSLGYDRGQIEELKREMIDTGFEIVRHATDNGYRTHEVGLDLGVDQKGHLWLIEANLAYPSYGLFNRLEDKTFYRKIKSLAEAYRKSRKKH
jgi:uncharacterized circularly permuted ATP-grasp superfamily protein